MTDAYGTVVGGVAAVLVVEVTTGVVALATGWTPRWGLWKILRPRLWGAGALTLAAGLAGFALLGPLTPLPDGPFGYVPGAFLSFGALLVGLIMQIVATNPAPRERARRTAS